MRTNRGPSTPTQMVTIRPVLSNVSDPHSAFCYVERRSGVRPSGPEPT